MARKRQLRNEWRKAPRKAPRREIGRTPNWVFRERREARRLTNREAPPVETLNGALACLCRHRIPGYRWRR